MSGSTLRRSIDLIVPTEEPEEDVIISYLYALSHCTWEDAVEILPPLEVWADGYRLRDGHHRLEVLKRMEAEYVDVVIHEDYGYAR